MESIYILNAKFVAPYKELSLKAMFVCDIPLLEIACHKF